MIRLTLVHWYDQTRGALLLNPSAVIAAHPTQREGVWYTQVNVAGYSYTVVESMDVIESMIRKAVATKTPGVLRAD